LTGVGDAEALAVTTVAGEFFEALGVSPLRGRWIEPQDDAKGAARVIVIGEGLWERRFERDDRVLGRTVSIDGQPCTVVGIMPASFEFPYDSDRTQAWLPVHAIGLTAQFADQRSASFMRGVASLRAGTTLERANAELATISANLAAQYPDSNRQRSVRAVPLVDVLVQQYRAGLLVLLAAVGVVLLVACVNVANLLLARGTTRRKEVAIRLALGADRTHLIRQFLAESVVLSVLAGGLGLLLATWTKTALVAASPIEIPRLRAVSVDGGVLAFVLAVSALTAIVFGVVPAFQSSGDNSAEALKSDGRAVSSAGAGRTRQTLVVAQIALSLMLLASAGLLTRSLVELYRVDPGFVPDRAAAMQLMLPASRYPDAASYVAFYNRAIDALRGVPGASAVGIATTLPLSGSSIGVGFTIEGRPVEADHESIRYFAVSPDYFKTMGIRVLRGRPFTDRDNATAPPVTIVSEAFARRYWPNEDAIGKRLTLRYNKTGPREIVAIVADVKHKDLAEATAGSVYAPFPQTPWPFLSAVVRSAGEPAATAAALGRVVPQLDPSLAPVEIKLLTDYVGRARATPQFTAALIAGFAALAMLLAGFGLYSMMAYSVAQRRREIGIRMALGAGAGDVRQMIVAHAVRLGAFGFGVGLIGALIATRALASLLFNVTAADPLAYAIACPLLAAVVLIAAYLPARRATRVDPIVVLRSE